MLWPNLPADEHKVRLSDSLVGVFMGRLGKSDHICNSHRSKLLLLASHGQSIPSWEIGVVNEVDALNTHPLARISL